ncbi:MAG TPA: class III poly(R)-hydroxyalkanoic acid synthase subunit PhaC [Syntrophales bacterium]|nr:class III poly(R)-hydroxyalkanoic acid synthase subunit PhaC [Syntrophales bacterium]
MSENIMETMIKETAKVQQKLLKGFENLMNIKDVESGVTPKELVYQEDKVQLFHYKPSKAVCPVPLLVVYALVNRQYMMDIQDDLSLFRKLVDHGLDLYVIDWGYPTKIDKYLTMEDYILGYMDNITDFVREKSGNEKINILGICQGGTFSVIYTALFPEKVKNLVTMVAPIDFCSGDALLNVWAPFIDADLMVDVLGNIPGEFLNLGFLWLKPFQLIIDKYVGLLDRIDDPVSTQNFLRMEKWIFDSPDQPGETFRKYVKELFQENRLCRGDFELGGRRVDLKKITMPVLNMFGEQDHLVSPKCSRPLTELVGSKDVTTLPYPVGHIGMYVSSRAQKEMPPTVAKWLIDRSGRIAKKRAKKISTKKKRGKAT